MIIIYCFILIVSILIQCFVLIYFDINLVFYTDCVDNYLAFYSYCFNTYLLFCTSVQKLDGERYPNRGQPNEKTFVRLHDPLRETGSFNPMMQNCGRPQSTRSLVMEERVLQIVEGNPQVRTREVKVTVEGIDYT